MKLHNVIINKLNIDEVDMESPYKYYVCKKEKFNLQDFYATCKTITSEQETREISKEAAKLKDNEVLEIVPIHADMLFEQDLL